MKVFVSGANGFQGRSIVQKLIKEGNQVVSMSRKEESTNENLKIVKGDLEDYSSIANAMKEVEVAVFNFPLVFDQDKAVFYTENFIKAAEQEKIDLVVFNPASDLPNSATDLLIVDIKLKVKELLDKSQLKVTTLIPDIYIDNISAPWSIPVIMEKGILPYPIENNKKIPWISHHDLANAINGAIQKPELAGQSIYIGGNLFSGEELATAISKKIDKPITFVSLTPDEFQAQLTPAFGEVPATEISNSYRYLQSNYEQIVGKDFSTGQDLLGIKPQSIEEWVDSVSWN